jgi:acetate kinase
MAERVGRHVLCVNSGSSSLKFHVYALGPTVGAERVLAKGAVVDLGQEDGRLRFKGADGEVFAEKALGAVGDETAIDEALSALASAGLPPIDAIGHRVVHGGPTHLAPEVITPGLIADLRAHIAWAPLHLPASLRIMEAVTAHHPDVPQVACFDTEFHAGMPEVARRLPLPRSFYDEGIHKYGFHGLSYEFVLGELAEHGCGRLIMAHLGNGASMVACRDGRPLETTMGMTPLGGFMMGSRTGDLDPGVPLYLVRERGYDDRTLERLLDKESGLKGVSGVTGDMETLLEMRADHPPAAQAVEMYCYQARKTVGALAAVLGGLDCLVFTGGIGEYAAAVRAEICEGLGFLGIELDAAANEAHAPVISTEGGGCTVRVVPTSEDLMIARKTCILLFGCLE